jgi:protein-arginine kinase activator protein McsA
VDREEFERAAEIRDEIRTLETEDREQSRQARPRAEKAP